MGVIEAKESLEGRVVRYMLSRDQAIDIRLDEAHRLAESMGGQDVGTLLLAGQHSGEQWYISLLELRANCYALYSHGTDSHDRIVFDIGLSLPKDEAFDAGPVSDGRYDEDPRDFFCINAGGEVMSYGG